MDHAKTISKLPSKQIIEGFTGRFVHTDNFTIAYWDIKAGAVLPEHHHIHVQTTQVMQGAFEMTVDGETYHCEPGKIVVIPSEAVHHGKALTDCKIMDVFSPRRDDYVIE
ncbi:MAG: cupin domain-containing protein [Cyclobacteriaceae bacterium]